MAIVQTEEIKTQIQASGVQLHDSGSRIQGARKGGAGPAEGITLLLNGSPASVPYAARFVARTPFQLIREQAQWALYRNGERLDIQVSLRPEPLFYKHQTKEGISYKKVALLHGEDCLATTVLQACSYWGKGTGCRFCGLGLSLKSGQTILKKDPEHLAEVAFAARNEGIRHITLTAGSTAKRRLENKLYQDAAQAIVQKTGLPVHVQLMPPTSRDDLLKLRDAGVKSLGLHLESFDVDVLQQVAPCKARLGQKAYIRAWREAVKIFGHNQVSSYLLMGIGETVQSLKDGCNMLASMGVYPYLVPFRPIPGTPLAHQKPSEPERVVEIYQEAAQILASRGLNWQKVKAGCVRCRGCSALPDYQDALSCVHNNNKNGQCFDWHVVQSGVLLKASFEIRRDVFVNEQGVFKDTDRDHLDSISYHILACKGQDCIGTVRITPLGEGLWQGSRLAVRQGYRGNIGLDLVKKAEAEVQKRGGKYFIAYIQMSRVKFFERCGWRSLKKIADYHGKPHMLMMAAGERWQETSLDGINSYPDHRLSLEHVGNMVK